MLFLEPDRTPFDLNFRLGRIPVRIHPMFWLMAAFLGWDTRLFGFQYLLVWIACVFVSILVHEMGHILMGRAFGTDGHIVLYSLGGLAVGSNGMSNRWQRIAVSFAGPLAGFLFAGAVLAGLAVFSPEHLQHLKDRVLDMFDLGDGRGALGPFHRTLFSAAIDDLIWINLFWGLLNLLPIWPLDGGQIARELLTLATPENGVRASLVLSGIVAGVLALHAALIYFGKPPLIPHLEFLGSGYTALFFGLMSLQSFLMLGQAPRGPRRPWQRRDDEEEERRPWERDPDYWKSGRRDPWD